MMTYRQERDEFIATMSQEGVPVFVSRALLTEADKLQKYAELSCSSKRADRDRVPCPRRFQTADGCLCEDHGAKDGDQHGDVPRHIVSEARAEARVTAICLGVTGLVPVFNGDPRGAVLKVRVPSGRDNGWGGVGVPARGYTTAQMERISR